MGVVRKTIIAAVLALAGFVLGCEESSEDAYVHMQMCEDKCEDTFDHCVCGKNYCDPMLMNDCFDSGLIMCSPELVPNADSSPCGVARNDCLEKC